MGRFNKRLGMEDGDGKSAIASTLYETWDKLVGKAKDDDEEEELKNEREDGEEDGEEDQGSEGHDGDGDGEGSASEGSGDDEGGEDEGDEGDEEDLDEAAKKAKEYEEEEDALLTPEIEPPNAWPDDTKKEFRELPPASREFLVNTYKGMQADYTRKAQGIAGINNALTPIHQECVENGLTYEDAVRRFVGIHERMKSDPNRTILEIAQLYGVEFDKVGQVQEAANDPVNQRLNQIEQTVQASTQTVAQQQMAQIDAMVQNFKKEAEFYDEVEVEMTNTVRMMNAQGIPIPSLQELYDRACWNVPSVRDKLIARQAGGDTKNNLQDRKERALKAKKASRSIKRRSKESESDQPGGGMSTKDILSAEWDAAASGGGK